MYRIIVLNVEDMKKKFANIAERKEMITSFEHNYNIGDTVYLIFLSKGKYLVRKKSGYKIEYIRFNLSQMPIGEEIEKSVYYWFEGKNPSVQMTPEYNCFPTLEEAERRCNLMNERFFND